MYYFKRLMQVVTCILLLFFIFDAKAQTNGYSKVFQSTENFTWDRIFDGCYDNTNKKVVMTTSKNILIYSYGQGDANKQPGIIKYFPHGHEFKHNHVKVSPNGKIFVSTHASDQDNKAYLNVWTSDGRNIKKLQLTRYTPVEFSADGKYFSAGGDIFLTSDFRKIYSTNAYNVLFAPDNKSFLAAGGALKNTVIFYDIDDGGQINEVDKFERKANKDNYHNGYFNCFDFDFNDSLVAEVRYDFTAYILLWDLKSDSILLDLRAESLSQISFSIDGKYLAMSRNPYTRVLSIDENRWVISDTHSGLSSTFLDFSNNGKYFFSTGKGESLVVHSLPTPPPYLNIEMPKTAISEKASGIFFNGEKNNLCIAIKNDGRGTAFGVTIIPSSTNPFLLLPKVVNVGSIPKNTIRKVNIPIEVSREATGGTASIKIITTELNGFGAADFMYDIVIGQQNLPEIKMDSLCLNDNPLHSNKYSNDDLMIEGITLQGNNNNVVENGEIFEVVFPVSNVGSGTAKNTKLELDVTTMGIDILKEDQSSVDVPPSSTHEFSYIMTVPRDFNGDIIELNCRVVCDNAALNIFKKTIPVSKLKPVFSIKNIIYDGNTTESRGNENQIIDGGEIIELKIELSNLSEIDAKNINIIVVTDNANIIFEKKSVHLDILPAKSKKVLESLMFAVKRSINVNSISLTYLIEQDDFSTESLSRELQINSGSKSSSGINDAFLNKKEMSNKAEAEGDLDASNSALKNTSANIIDATKYFPKDIKLEHTYFLNILQKSGNLHGKVKVVNTGVENINGVDYVKTKIKYSGVKVKDQIIYTRVTNDAIWGITSEDTKAPEYIDVSLPLYVNKKWTSTLPNYSIEQTLVSIESIKILEKEYNDCLKIVGDGKFNNNDLTFKTIYYFAPNIGLIKSDIIYSNGTRCCYNLEKYKRK